MNTLTLKSFAKLNLFLQVLNKRPDNYHNIETLFERISLFDSITLTLRRDRTIRVICADQNVPTDGTNLCYKSAKLLQDRFKVKKGVDIKIVKRIPVGAGLGGGSSDAAGALLGLNKLWKLNIPLSRLVTFSKQIGCDVPFFIYNTSFAKGSRRGDRIMPLGELKNLCLWHILAVPNINVSTPLVYKKWDKISGLTPTPVNKIGTYRKLAWGLTMSKYDVNIITLALRKKAFSVIPLLLFNGLEEATVRLYPQVRRIKEKLSRLGVKSILMSGSGPAVFGIVASRKEAVRVSSKLKKTCNSCKVFVARTF